MPTRPETMRAMVLEREGAGLLVDRARPRPEPGPGQVLVDVSACGVCRTDLHVVDGELAEPALPLVPGHEIVGRVAARGAGVEGLELGARVGVPWLAWTCGTCERCRGGQENLCPRARYTGYTVDGGYAEQVVADARYVFPLELDLDDASAAPLLCAGLIGWRAWRLARESVPEVRRLGLWGFGAAAHLLAQIAAHEGREVFAFTRPGDGPAQRLARACGAAWAGGSDEAPPAPLEASILFAPVGDLVPTALGVTVPGGVVVCGGIHMSDIPSFPYRLLWEERVVRSVANLTRDDARELLEVARTVPLDSRVTRYPLVEANRALEDLRSGRVHGAAVLEI